MEPSAEPTAAVYCRHCYHDLGSGRATLDDGSSGCSECGRAFDPSNPRTFARRPRSRVELVLLRRVAPGLMLGLLLFSLLWNAWIPRPVAMFGGWGPNPGDVTVPEASTLWVWRGALYGSTTLSLPSSSAEAWMWGDKVRWVRGYNRRGAEMNWEILWEPSPQAPGGGIWTMRVVRPMSLSFDLLSGFRVTREGILGVVVGAHDPSVTVEPFEATGSEADILSAYIRATGVSVRPMRSDPDQALFWVFDEEQDRLVQVDQSELDRRAIEPVNRMGIGLFHP